MAVGILGEKEFEALQICEQGIELCESNQDFALAHLQFKKAHAMFPDSPKINSWLGYTYGLVENKVALAQRHCKMAIDSGEPDPLFYRNMGKLYLIQNNKRSAIGAFARGLQIDPSNREILREWKVLGFRRKPFFSFLSRDNPLNVLIGKYTWKLGIGRKK
jgi:Flp pilus assembly protein TadD